MNSVLLRSPSAALRQLCLAGLALSPAAAVADPRGPECTPVPPRSVFSVGTPTLVAPPGAVSALLMDGQGQRWAFGENGQVWFGSPYDINWEARNINTRADLTVAAAGRMVWAAGAGGKVWSIEAGKTWKEQSLPGKGTLTFAAAGYNTIAFAGAAGELYVSSNNGEPWAQLATAEAPDITALGADIGVVVAARADKQLLVARHQAVGEGWDWIPEPLPLPEEATVIRDLLLQGPDIFVLLDEAGGIWSTYDGGKSWFPGKSLSGAAPARALTRTALGLTVVHVDGAASVMEMAYETPARLSTIASYATYGAPGGSPAGVMVVDAVGHQQTGLLSLTADGQLLRQELSHHIEGGHPCGRPFEVAQSAVVAPAVAGEGWGGVALAPAALPAASRAALAAAWLRDAQAEHASVASFARFALRLLALGAPAALVADAQAAMGDEIRHAERCFALASRYAGEPLRPGPLPLDGALDGGEDLVAVSVEVLREGAIGESIGALLADAMRQQATDPAVREALTEIAEDEARHAQAAWRFLAWAVAEGGAPVRAALSAALEAAISEHLPDAVDKKPAPIGWAAHGRLAAAEQRRTIRRAIRQVVRPCAAALLH
ncbi:MAG: ferritin-like domain-containing protein [Myxococcota bacterium]